MEEFVYETITEIDNKGATLKGKDGIFYVSFEECVRNYCMENNLSESKCIATRNVEELTYTFFTNPKRKVVFKRDFWTMVYCRKTATQRFMELQKAIEQAEYSSRDLS
ncbi:MAG: hypothetical protein IJ315_01225 [Firmicutes bacterium]|nr:hypothetical protein [Bacillota bacterium]